MHQRMKIRKKVLQMLEAGHTGAAVRDKIEALNWEDLPTLTVYCPDDTVQSDSVATAPRELTHDLTLVIEGLVAPAENPWDAMDDLSERIEDIMERDPFLGDTAAQSILADTNMEVQDDGEHHLGFLSMTYAVTYRTRVKVHDSAFDDFNTAAVTYRHDGSDAHDTIILQEPT